MKKTLVALAALSAMSAFAQSSVTIYGAVDAGYANSTLNNGTNTYHKANVTGSNSYTSRLGFTGVEELGAGQKAGFTYEVALSSLGGDSNNSGAFATSQSAGLRTGQVFISDNNLGTVTAGYGMTARHAQAATLDMTGGANIAGNLMTAVGVGHATGTTTGTKGTPSLETTAGSTGGAYTNNDYLLRANAVSYTSPTFAGGLALTYGHIFGDNQRSVNADGSEVTQNLNLRADAVALSYLNGPLTVLASTTRTVSDNGLNGAAAVLSATALQGKVQTNTIFGGIYDLGFAKISAGLYQDKVQWQNYNGAADTADILNRGYQIGIRGSLPGTKVELLAQLARGTYTGDNAATATSTDTGGAGNENRTQTGQQYGAIYNFSKRTTAYALYGVQTRELPTNEGAIDKVYAVGIRHNF